MRLLIDMNLSPRWCAFLARRGIPALHWCSAGPPSATDSDILAYAHRRRYVLLTAGLSLAALAELTRRSAISVVQIGAPDLTPEIIGEEVITALRVLETQLRAGALVQVRPHGAASAVPLGIEEPDIQQHALPSQLDARALITGGMPGKHSNSVRREPQPAQA